MKTTAIDYETFYSKDCTIKNGLTGYLKHPDFDAYMVSIYSDDNFAWVGHPKDAPWDQLKGHRVLAHNRNFDQPVHEHLISTGVIPNTEFGDFQCTSDMASYLGWGRSLAEALKNECGVLMVKDVRNAMKGKTFHQISKEEKKELAEYALYDSKGCLTLWERGGEGWPDHERDLSHETTRMCQQGVPIDEHQVDLSIETLERGVEQSLDLLPWADVKEGALSTIEWAQFCRTEGVEPPPSTSKADPITLAWMKDHPKQGEILEAMHNLRGANVLVKKFKTLKSQIVDGRFPYGMKYFGAHTGRDSGDKGFNMQNLPRDVLYGVNLRKCIKAPSGKVLIIADLAQIEARCAAYLAQETSVLDAAREGGDWYEAQARGFGLWKKEESLKKSNPALRHTMKQMSLGCQFGMGAPKFASITGVEFEEAQSMVRLYRAKAPKLVALWKKLERDMRRSVIDTGTYTIGLPSGREMTYNNVMVKNGLSAEIIQYGSRSRLKFWGGKLMENATQAFARDVFMDRVLALRKSGHNIIMRVHDEVVIEADASDSKDAASEIQQILTTSPEWCKGLPLGTEVEIVNHYRK